MLIIILIAITIISCLSFLFMAAYVVNFKMKVDRLEEAIDEYEEMIDTLREEVKRAESHGTPQKEAISYKDAQNINWKDVKFK